MENPKYQVREVLGGGIFAEVLLAHDVEANRSVVIKSARLVPLDDGDATGGVHFALGFEAITGSMGQWLPEPNEVIDFERRVLAECEHPSMVRLLDAGVDRGQHFLVLEFIEGHTWRRALAEGKPPRVKHVIELAEALKAMADAGRPSYHGDLKPDNLLIDTTGRVRIIDPSSGATAFDANGAPKHLLTTPWYNPHYAASDIPSLGALLIEIATNMTPFTSPDETHLELSESLQEDLRVAAAVGRSQVWRNVRRLALPTLGNPEYPAALEAVALKCLGLALNDSILDTAEPYRDLHAVLADLRPFAAL